MTDELTEKVRDVEGEIIRKEKDLQIQWEDDKIREAKYNRRYKDFIWSEEGPRYLREEKIKKVGIGNGIRALVKLRCGNLEERNKYWMENDERKCIFCKEKQDCIDCIVYYMNNCRITQGWF